MNFFKAEGIFSEGFGFIAKSVMKDKELNIHAKAMYSYICSFAGAGDSAFPSRERICDDLGIGKDTFTKNMKILVEKGYVVIEKTRAKGTFMNNNYRIPVNPIIIENRDVSPCTVSSDTVPPDTVQKDTINNIFKNNIFKNKNNHDNHDNVNVIDEFYDFEKLVKEISDNQLNFTKTIRGAIKKLLKTMSRENIKTYIQDLYSALKNNPQVLDANRVFVEKLKKGERQINTPTKIVPANQPEVVEISPAEQQEAREIKKLEKQYEYCLSMAFACGWGAKYTVVTFEQSVQDCSLERIFSYSQKLRELLEAEEKAGLIHA